MSFTRVPRRASDGKPLPRALRDDSAVPVFIEDEEPTERIVSEPDELDAHLRQRAEAGQGDDLNWTFGPRKAAR